MNRCVDSPFEYSSQSIADQSVNVLPVQPFTALIPDPTLTFFSIKESM